MEVGSGLQIGDPHPRIDEYLKQRMLATMEARSRPQIDSPRPQIDGDFELKIPVDLGTRATNRRPRLRHRENETTQILASVGRSNCLRWWQLSAILMAAFSDSTVDGPFDIAPFRSSLFPPRWWLSRLRQLRRLSRRYHPLPTTIGSRLSSVRSSSY
ncbi:hypothetical protein CRG98_044469 [Punica granatum]|uniref:Uncharacterized protein n=1 Tax=Punica granatum TaxID=22663 RepID=A0A2I0HU02_PUNGR|nr:hypothetical protein CRG98_044469 [Punica granatum]